ncbi:MAG TPA: SRPBCC family protein [Paracoccaceae bacterium]|nr:SRPBCC family protein [Paracoccaceae bacterium]
MDLTNTFVVPVPPDRAWPLLLDVERIAPCLPGATLTEMVDPRSFKGRATVKVGPVALTFDGSAKLVDVDDTARTARLEARGNDAKGRGGAQAEARFALVPEGSGTRVTVNTHLVMNGAVAQYGRASGLMQEVANQLVTQFATNLAAQLDQGPQDPAPAAAPAANAVSGLGLIGASLRAIIARWFRRLTGSGS